MRTKSGAWFCDLCKNEIMNLEQGYGLTLFRGLDLVDVRSWDLCLSCTENLLGGAPIEFPLQEGEEEAT